MAKIQIQWEAPKLNLYDHSEFFSALPEEIKSSGKPIVIYLESALEDDQLKTNLANAALADERVAIGSHMFHTFKMDGQSLNKEHPHWKLLGGRELPRFVVLDADGKKIGIEEGQVTPSGLYGNLKKAATVTYKTNIDSYVKEQQKLLTELDKLESRKTTLATKRKAEDHVTAAMEREWKIEDAEIAKLVEDVEARHAKLNQFQLKDDKKVTKN